MKSLLVHIAQRWDIEVLFADVKELLGIDQYQVVNAEATLRSPRQNHPDYENHPESVVPSGGEPISHGRLYQKDQADYDAGLQGAAQQPFKERL